MVADMDMVMATATAAITKISTIPTSISKYSEFPSVGVSAYAGPMTILHSVQNYPTHDI